MIGEILMRKYNYLFFTTYVVDLTESQIEELKAEFDSMIRLDVIHDVTFEEFFSTVPDNEIISMRCLRCKHRLELSFSVYKPFIENKEIAFPIDYCPKCRMMQFVPNDVYNKLFRK